MVLFHNHNSCIVIASFKVLEMKCSSFSLWHWKYAKKKPVTFLNETKNYKHLFGLPMDLTRKVMGYW